MILVKIEENETVKNTGARSFEHECSSDTYTKCRTWNDSQNLGKKTAEFGDKGPDQGNTDHTIVKINLDSEKCPGDLMRFANTQIE